MKLIKRYVRFAALILTIPILNGCSVAAIKKHNPHYTTTKEIQKVDGVFSIGNISTPEAKEKPGYYDIKATKTQVARILESTSIQCRLTTFNMPNKQTVKDYIEESLTFELDAAEKLNQSNGNKIDLIVNAISVDSSDFTTGIWTIDIDYVLNGKNHRVVTNSEFESAFAANVACTNAANAFSDALAENFLKLMKGYTTKK